MERIINGGIYRVDFSGSCSAVIDGTHPAIVIRTLKENEVYMVLPLTSYTREKMDKVRRSGWGIHISSTNSIILVEKYQVIHISTIKNRWKTVSGENLKIDPTELKRINTKFNEYVKLSTDKADKEYNQYYIQYQELKSNLSSNVKKCSYYDVFDNGTTLIINFNKTAINKLSKTDISELIEQNFGVKNAQINLGNGKCSVIIK